MCTWPTALWSWWCESEVVFQFWLFGGQPCPPKIETTGKSGNNCKKYHNYTLHESWCLWPWTLDMYSIWPLYKERAMKCCKVTAWLSIYAHHGGVVHALKVRVCSWGGSNMGRGGGGMLFCQLLQTQKIQHPPYGSVVAAKESCRLPKTNPLKFHLKTSHTLASGEVVARSCPVDNDFSRGEVNRSKAEVSNSAGLHQVPRPCDCVGNLVTIARQDQKMNPPPYKIGKGETS